MTECNGCGACCDPVVLPFTKAEALTRPDLDAGTRRFIRDDLTALSRKDGKAKTAWMLELEHEWGAVWTGLDGSPQAFYYACRWFDGATRACTNYENRPALCRTYPVADGEAVPLNAALPPTCSFRADQGRPVVPFEQLT